MVLKTDLPQVTGSSFSLELKSCHLFNRTSRFLPPTFYFTSSPPASYIKAANTSLGVIRVATEFEDVRLWGIGDEKSGVSEARIRAVCNAMKPVATLKEGPGEEDKHRYD